MKRSDLLLEKERQKQIRAFIAAQLLSGERERSRRALSVRHERRWRGVTRSCVGDPFRAASPDAAARAVPGSACG
eukprot:6200034-Pleurochrysis_carterae.AAC.1